MGTRVYDFAFAQCVERAQTAAVDNARCATHSVNRILLQEVSELGNVIGQSRRVGTGFRQEIRRRTGIVEIDVTVIYLQLIERVGQSIKVFQELAVRAVRIFGKRSRRN